jgi:hypothetical protein
MKTLACLLAIGLSAQAAQTDEAGAVAIGSTNTSSTTSRS